MKNKLSKLMIALFTTTLVARSPMTVFADEIHDRDVTFKDKDHIF